MSIRKFFSNMAAASLLTVQLIAPAQAAVVDTRHYLDTVDRQAVIAEVEGILSRQDVSDKLIALGVDPAVALGRVKAMSNAELATLSGQLEALPAGGNGVIEIIGILFVILLILEVVGVINIFNR